MYEYISGKITSLEPTQVVIDCGGIGYLLEISLPCFEQLRDSNPESTVRLLVHEVIREDEHLLYGFNDEGERAMFRLLIGVNGVGVATARVMLSSMGLDDLRNAIASQDVKTIQRIKGIGAKTAQRIAIELQDKVGGVLTGSQSGSSASAPSQSKQEALTALTMLGFPRTAADKVLQSLDANLSVEELIKESLRRL